MSSQLFSVSASASECIFLSDSDCTFLAERRKLVTLSENMNLPQLSICVWRADVLFDSSVRSTLRLGNDPPLPESCLQFQKQMKTVSGSQFDLVFFSFQPVEEAFCEDECSCWPPLPLHPPSARIILHGDKRQKEPDSHREGREKMTDLSWED